MISLLIIIFVNICSLQDSYVNGITNNELSGKTNNDMAKSMNGEYGTNSNNTIPNNRGLFTNIGILDNIVHNLVNLPSNLTTSLDTNKTILNGMELFGNITQFFNGTVNGIMNMTNPIQIINWLKKRNLLNNTNTLGNITDFFKGSIEGIVNKQSPNWTSWMDRDVNELSNKALFEDTPNLLKATPNKFQSINGSKWTPRSKRDNSLENQNVTATSWFDGSPTGAVPSWVSWTSTGYNPINVTDIFGNTTHFFNATMNGVPSTNFTNFTSWLNGNTQPSWINAGANNTVQTNSPTWISWSSTGYNPINVTDIFGNTMHFFNATINGVPSTNFTNFTSWLNNNIQPSWINAGANNTVQMNSPTWISWSSGGYNPINKTDITANTTSWLYTLPNRTVQMNSPTWLSWSSSGGYNQINNTDIFGNITNLFNGTYGTSHGMAELNLLNLTTWLKDHNLPNSTNITTWTTTLPNSTMHLTVPNWISLISSGYHPLNNSDILGNITKYFNVTSNDMPEGNLLNLTTWLKEHNLLSNSAITVNTTDWLTTLPNSTVQTNAPSWLSWSSGGYNPINQTDIGFNIKQWLTTLPNSTGQTNTPGWISWSSGGYNPMNHTDIAANISSWLNTLPNSSVQTNAPSWISWSSDGYKPINQTDIGFNILSWLTTLPNSSVQTNVPSWISWSSGDYNPINNTHLLGNITNLFNVTSSHIPEVDLLNMTTWLKQHNILLNNTDVTGNITTWLYTLPNSTEHVNVPSWISWTSSPVTTAVTTAESVANTENYIPEVTDTDAMTTEAYITETTTIQAIPEEAPTPTTEITASNEAITTGPTSTKDIVAEIATTHNVSASTPAQQGHNDQIVNIQPLNFTTWLKGKDNRYNWLIDSGNQDANKKTFNNITWVKTDSNESKGSGIGYMQTLNITPWFQPIDNSYNGKDISADFGNWFTIGLGNGTKNNETSKTLTWFKVGNSSAQSLNITPWFKENKRKGITANFGNWFTIPVNEAADKNITNGILNFSTTWLQNIVGLSSQGADLNANSSDLSCKLGKEILDILFGGAGIKLNNQTNFGNFSQSIKLLNATSSKIESRPGQSALNFIVSQYIPVITNGSYSITNDGQNMQTLHHNISNKVFGNITFGGNGIASTGLKDWLNSAVGLTVNVNGSDLPRNHGRQSLNIVVGDDGTKLNNQTFNKTDFGNFTESIKSLNVSSSEIENRPGQSALHFIVSQYIPVITNGSYSMTNNGHNDGIMNMQTLHHNISNKVFRNITFGGNETAYTRSKDSRDEHVFNEGRDLNNEGQEKSDSNRNVEIPQNYDLEAESNLANTQYRDVLSSRIKREDGGGSSWDNLFGNLIVNSNSTNATTGSPSSTKESTPTTKADPIGDFTTTTEAATTTTTESITFIKSTTRRRRRKKRVCKDNLIRRIFRRLASLIPKFIDRIFSEVFSHYASRNCPRH